MKNVLAALKLVLADLTKLEVPTIATAVAGVAAPIVLALFNVDFAPGVIAGWLTLAGGAAATLQKIVSGQAAAAANAKK